MADQYEEAGNRGHSYIWEQRWEEAVEAFELALKGRPNEPDLYDGLATAQKELGQFGQALHNYKEAARISDGDAIYLEQLGEMQQKQGKYADAGATYHAIAQRRLKERRLDEAVEKWMIATRLNPDILEAHENLAQIYVRQKRAMQAVNEYMEVARLQEAAGSQGRALDACKKALKLDPRNPDVLTAIELIQNRQPAFKNYKRPSTTSMAQQVEIETDNQSRRTVAPVDSALQRSRERLAEDIFTAGENIPQALPVISQALDYQTRDMVSEAIQSYEQAIGMGFSTAATHLNLGLLYQENLQFEEAIEQLQQAADGDSEYGIACHFALGESHRAMGKTEEAVLHFINVLRLVDYTTVDQTHHTTLDQQYEALAADLLEQDERDKASAFSNTLVEFLSGDDWENKVLNARKRLNGLSGQSGIMILGDILSAGSSRVLESLYIAQQHNSDGFFDAAIEETYRAIEINPTYLPAHMQIAEFYVSKGLSQQATDKLMMIGKSFMIREDSSGAAQAYERAVQIAPFNLSLRNDLIDLLRQNGDTDRAIQQYMGLGDSYYQIAQSGEARQAYIDALKLSQRSGDEPKWRQQILRKIGDIDVQRFAWKQAAPVYKELRRSDPQDEQIFVTLVDLHYKLGDKKAALREVDGYLVQLAKSGRGKEIAPILDKLIAQRPADADLTERLARLYVQQRKRKEAIETLDSLGEAQLEAGNTHGAIKTIKKLLALKPTNTNDYLDLLKSLQG